MNKELIDLMCFLNAQHKVYLDAYEAAREQFQKGKFGFWSLSEAHKMTANIIMDTINEIADIIIKNDILEGVGSNIP